MAAILSKLYKCSSTQHFIVQSECKIKICEEYDYTEYVHL